MMDVFGCVVPRRFDQRRCEAKRLYVRPPFRGRGLGQRLLEWVIAEARRAGVWRNGGRHHAGDDHRTGDVRPGRFRAHRTVFGSSHGRGDLPAAEALSHLPAQNSDRRDHSLRSRLGNKARASYRAGQQARTLRRKVAWREAGA